MRTTRILIGDVRQRLRDLADESVHCVVTSPPYFGLRDYGCDGQIGLEPTPDAYVAEMVAVFREVRRVLRQDGTFWLNLGDSYGKGKQLVGIPWRVAFALQNDGWYLRQDIIWAKPNPMPESVRDRCTRSHEYIFLMTKTPSYVFDIDAIKEPSIDAGKIKGGRSGYIQHSAGGHNKDGLSANGAKPIAEKRNKRSVWTIAPKAFPGAHFATFPPDLIRPCIKAGCPEGGTVLDPFFGAGTTGLVAAELNRSCIGVELNPAYAAIAQQRLGLLPPCPVPLPQALPPCPVPLPLC